MVNRLRLASGLVLFVFVLGHLLNHALGLISLEAMNAGLAVFILPWRGWAGTALLAGAVIVHVGVALWSFARRRSLRLPRWEWAQLSLGFAIPFLLLEHVAGTRLASEFAGVDDDYTLVQLLYWEVLSPRYVIQQILLTLVVWVHGCIGIHYWLRVKVWYPRAVPLLYAGALLVPALALGGFVSSGMEIRSLAGTPGFVEATLGAGNVTPATVAFVDGVTNAGLVTAVLMLLAAASVQSARFLYRKRPGAPRLIYRDSRVLDIMPGATALDTIRAAGIGHASVCGGRGRCSTCRVRVGAGADALAPPSLQEQRVLERISAPPNVRLACQIRPTRDLEVTPLLPPTATAREGLAMPRFLAGEELEIAILFADLRDYTGLAEAKLPFDTVFILNRFFEAMGRAIEQSGGRVDKFLGDGVMALFGLGATPETACRQALDAARAMAERLEELNGSLAADLPRPLRMGIGIAFGPVIVGELGYGPGKGLTAIGDAVNLASRLEALSKERAAQLVVTDEVARRAGRDLSVVAAEPVQVKGKREPVLVRLIGLAGDEPAGAPTASQPGPRS